MEKKRAVERRKGIYKEMKEKGIDRDGRDKYI